MDIIFCDTPAHINGAKAAHVFIRRESKLADVHPAKKYDQDTFTEAMKEKSVPMELLQSLFLIRILCTEDALSHVISKISASACGNTGQRKQNQNYTKIDTVSSNGILIRFSIKQFHLCIPGYGISFWLYFVAIILLILLLPMAQNLLSLWQHLEPGNISLLLYFNFW